MARSRRESASAGSEEPRGEGVAPEAAEGVPPAERGAEGVAFAEPGPHERVYAVVFGRVWLAALAAVSAMSRWSAVATDPVRGEIRVEVGSMLRKTTRPARVTVVLDDMGLTRVDAAFLHEGGARAEGVETGQIARFHRRLETLLRRDSRA